jgi:hypothetical protein
MTERVASGLWFTGLALLFVATMLGMILGISFPGVGETMILTVCCTIGGIGLLGVIAGEVWLHKNRHRFHWRDLL